MKMPESTFNNDKRYIFNNWSNETFIGKWDGQAEIINPGEIKELPEYKAYYYTKHFVNREMDKVGKSAFSGIDAERAPFEEKTCTLITGDTESPALASLKDKLRAELQAEIKGTTEEVAVETTEEETPVDTPKTTKKTTKKTTAKNDAFVEAE